MNLMQNVKKTDLTCELADLCKKYRLSAIYAFGSRAAEAVAFLNGEAASSRSAFSDMDFGVLPRDGVKMELHEKVKLTGNLEDLFAVGRADLILLPEADPFLATNIIRGERIFCVDTDAVDDYELYILRRAGDLIPFERERIARIMGNHS
jgi:hypothetical protein